MVRCNSAMWRGEYVKLTGQEATTLYALAIRRGSMLLWTELTEILWAHDIHGGPLWEKTIRGLMVTRLRKKMPGLPLAVQDRVGVRLEKPFRY